MENPDDVTERNHIMMENPDDCTERHHMEIPNDGTDAFCNERTSRQFRGGEMAMVHHAHCEMKNGPKIKLT